jgi:hypothetical protein
MNWDEILIEDNILVRAMYQAFEKYEANSYLKDNGIDCC